MALGSHKAVIAGVDHLAGRAMGRSAKQYGKDIAPLMEAIKKAEGPADLKRRLTPGLTKRLGTDAIGTALTDAGVQASLIATAAAWPGAKKRMKAEG